MVQSRLCGLKEVAPHSLASEGGFSLTPTSTCRVILSVQVSLLPTLLSPVTLDKGLPYSMTPLPTCICNVSLPRKVIITSAKS